MSLEERLWSKIDVRGDDECWPWRQGHAHLKEGYGLIRVVGKKSMQKASRVVWELTNGPIPAGIHILHRCDNPPCCNPVHLFQGTNADNVADKVAKGRSSFPNPWRRRERHHFAKLTESQVQEIRSLSTGRRGEGVELAARYRVSPATIGNILKRKVWAHC